LCRNLGICPHELPASSPAQACLRKDQDRTIGRGKFADLVLLPSDPATDGGFVRIPRDREQGFHGMVNTDSTAT
jgi:hypothetical protein